MHYRLAETRDPLVGIIREAVTRVLVQVETVKRDSNRLGKEDRCLSLRQLSLGRDEIRSRMLTVAPKPLPDG